MTYTEKENITKLLQVFEDLVKGNEYFDILYSEKVGYVQLFIEDTYGGGPTYEILEDYESVARALFNEVIDSVRDLLMCGEHKDVDLYPAEQEEANRRVMQYLARMGDDAARCKEIWQEMLNQFPKMH